LFRAAGSTKTNTIHTERSIIALKLELFCKATTKKHIENQRIRYSIEAIKKVKKAVFKGIPKTGTAIKYISTNVAIVINNRIPKDFNTNRNGFLLCTIMSFQIPLSFYSEIIL